MGGLGTLCCREHKDVMEAFLARYRHLSLSIELLDGESPGNPYRQAKIKPTANGHVIGLSARIKANTIRSMVTFYDHQRRPELAQAIRDMTSVREYLALLLLHEAAHVKVGAKEEAKADAWALAEYQKRAEWLPPAAIETP
jgi:hypothetical protein